MIKFIGIVGVRLAFREARLAGIHPVSDAGATRLRRAATQWPVVHLARLVVPEIGVETVRMLSLPRQFLHRSVLLELVV